MGPAVTWRAGVGIRFRFVVRSGCRIDRQAGVLAIDIDQRVNLAMNADRRDAPDEYRMRSVVELRFPGADDVRLRIGQDRDAGVLAPYAASEAILAAGLAAASDRDLDLAAVEDVDGKGCG